MYFGPRVTSTIGSSEMSLLRHAHACNYLLSSPEWSGRCPSSVFLAVRMGVSLVQQIDVESDIPALVVRGNSDEVNWDDPRYKEFVTRCDSNMPLESQDGISDTLLATIVRMYNLVYFRNDFWCDVAASCRISTRHSMMLVPIKLTCEKTKHLIKPSVRG